MRKEHHAKLKKALIVLIVGMLGLFLPSCANQMNHVAISDLDVIPSETLLEEYDEFWNQFKDNYIFIPILEEKGIELPYIEEKYREIIESKELNIKDYFELLEKMLEEMDNFAHLQMVYPSWSKYYIDSEYDYLLNYTPKALDIARSTYKKLQEMMSSEEEENHRDSINPQVNFYYDSKTVCIRYTTFSYDDEDRDRGLLLEALSDACIRMGGVDNLIIDMRGNGGGNTEYWKGSIVGPLGGYIGWKIDFFTKKAPLLSDELKSYKPISEYPKGKTLPQFVEQLGLDYYLEVEETIEDTSESGTDIDISSIKKYVLIDNYVYSAADNFAMFCKDTGWATLIGQPTKGDGAGGMPMGIVLKNTGIIIRFSVSASPNDKGELNTDKGTNPDIFTLKEDALEKCLSIIG